MPPKKKAASAANGTEFVGVDGKTYVLPPLSPTASMKVPAGLTMDMLEDPSDGMTEMRHNFAMLKANDTPADVLAAFRALETGEATRTLLRWLGESRGSSRPSGATEEPSSTTSEPGSTSA